MQPPILLPHSATELLSEFVLRKIQRGPNEVLGPGKEHKVLERYVEGYLVFTYLWTDNPDVTVSIDLYGDGTVETKVSPRILYEHGLVLPSASAPWVSRYDDEAKVYVALYTPSPWIPWRGFARVKIVNPSVEEARYTFALWILEREKRRGWQ